jgi:S-DNA-T family DNA segregation ATPase FtsK/SpoIIIE
MAKLLASIRSGRSAAPLPAFEAELDAFTVGGTNDDAPSTSVAIVTQESLARLDNSSAEPAKVQANLTAQTLPQETPRPAPESPPQLGTFRPGVAAMIAARPVAAAALEGQAWLQTATTRLKSALKGYGLTCDVVGTRLTPNSALIRFRGNESMTVDAVQKRVSTLLTSHALEIVAVRPAKGEVVVMVARDSRVILPTLDLWARRQLSQTAPLRNTSFVLGEREDNGEIIYLNLGGAFAGQPQHGPHTLIAGETGGGKGVFTANLLLDICATNAPSEARIWLVDPKAGIDYGWIESVPHLDGAIVTTPDAAIEALKALVEEMERRYAEVLAPSKSQNLDVYNAGAPIDQRLPRIYFFHDELADWMADKTDARYRDAVSDYVVRLSGKARAAGIHLFLITQRPDKDALPGLIKANMNNKIALKVSNRLNSQIILDETGAEGLLGHGHMIAKLANQPGGLVYAQAPYLAPNEAVAVADAIAQA